MWFLSLIFPFKLVLFVVGFSTVNSRFIYTSTVGSHPFLINSPYALQYPYYDGSPLLLTYPQLYGPELKHHTPDHKEDDAEVIKPKEEEKTGKPLKLYSFGLPLQYHIPGPIALPGASQYHSQDELGQYQYGYNNPLSSKNEIKTFDGITRGSYSYLDSEGKYLFYILPKKAPERISLFSLKY